MKNDLKQLKMTLIQYVFVALVGIFVTENLVWNLERVVFVPFLQELVKEGLIDDYNLWDGLRLTGRLVGDILSEQSSLITLDWKSISLVTFLLTLMNLLTLIPFVAVTLWVSTAISKKVDQLQHEQERYFEAENRRRFQMLSNLAHDLKTPITSMRGLSQAISDGMVRDEETKKQYCKAIESKLERMTELITILFDFAKLNSDGFALHRERMNLTELLFRDGAAIYTDLEEAGYRLEIDIAEEACLIYGDSSHLSRLVTNLLINAMVHNPPGTRILLKLKRIAGAALVIVADTGELIEGDPEELFHPFVRGDKARATDGGSGLGLAIAAKVAELHGFRLQLQQPYEEEGYRKAFILTCKTED